MENSESKKVGFKWSMDVLSWIVRGFRSPTDIELGCATAITCDYPNGEILDADISEEPFGCLDVVAGSLISRQRFSTSLYHHSFGDFLLDDGKLKLRSHAQLALVCVRYVEKNIPATDFTENSLSSAPRLSFLRYACRFLLEHYRQATDTDETLYRLDLIVISFLEKKALCESWYKAFRAQLPLITSEPYELTPLNIACNQGLSRIANRFINKVKNEDLGKIDIALSLALASSHNNTELIENLLARKATCDVAHSRILNLWQPEPLHTTLVRIYENHVERKTLVHDTKRLNKEEDKQGSRSTGGMIHDGNKVDTKSTKEEGTNRSDKRIEDDLMFTLCEVLLSLGERKRHNGFTISVFPSIIWMMEATPCCTWLVWVVILKWYSGF